MHSVNSSNNKRLVFLTIVVVLGMAITVKLIYTEITSSISLSEQSKLGLRVLAHLDQLNSSITYIERNEKPFVIIEKRNSINEINNGYQMARNALDSLSIKEFKPIINQNEIDSLRTIFSRKQELSNEIIRLSLNNQPQAAIEYFINSNDSSLISNFYRQYYGINNRLKNFIVSQQEQHLSETKIIYNILLITLFVVLALLLFSISRLLKQIQLKDDLLIQNKTFDDIINFSSDAILLYDLNFKITYANQATQDLFGYTREEMLGQNPDKIFQTIAPELEIVEKTKSLYKYGFWMGELKRKDHNGKTIELHVASNSYKDLKGNIKGYFSIFSDISKLVNAQGKIKALADSLAEANVHLNEQVTAQTDLIKDVFERVKEVFIGTDTQFKINYVSKHIEAIFGLAIENVMGIKVQEFLSVIAGPGFIEIPTASFDSNQNRSFEFIHQQTGSWFEGNVYPSKNGISIYFKDITESIKSKAEILKSQKMYEFISKASEQILLAKNADELFQNICEVAVSFDDILFCWIGAPEKDSRIIKPIKWAGKEEGYLTAIKSITTNDMPEGKGPTGLAYKTGKYYYVNDIATDPVMTLWREEALKRGYRSDIAIPIKVDSLVAYIFTLYTSKPYFFTEDQIGLLLNISENISFTLNAFKVADLKKASDNELQKVLKAIEQSSASIVISDVEGKIEYVNPAFSKLTGYSFLEVIGQNPRILKTGYTSDKEYKNLWDKLTHQAEWHGEFCNKKKNGELYWEYAVISPVLNDEGVISNYVAVKENITSRKILEEDQKKLTTDLFKRNHDLEQFSYILSHNIRGPLSNILGLKNALLRDSSNGIEPILIQAISDSAESIDQVIKDVTQIIHTKTLSLEEKKLISFEDLLNSVKNNIESFISEKQAIFQADFSKAPNCFSLESYLNSIFYHLSNNALKFSKKGIVPRIEIWTELSIDRVLIHFKDHGMGIDLNRYGKSIFSLYKRFSLNIEGRGIGLYLVKSQIEFLGGDIEIKSDLNGWTEFIISLPYDQSELILKQ